MKITCISDLHGSEPELEGGDLLIVAGDLTAQDGLKGHSDCLNWLSKQKYTKKIVIAGNHDNFLQENPNFYSNTEIDYLCDSGTIFEGVRIWGSPWTNWFVGVNPHCKAFMGSEYMLWQRFKKIPLNTDILVTHSPPYTVLDVNREGKCVGSTNLLMLLDALPLKLHVFGHIHEGYGQMLWEKPGYGEENNIRCINASIMNEDYEPLNKPINIEFYKTGEKDGQIDK